MKLPEPPASIADEEAFDNDVVAWIEELEARVQTTRRQGRERVGIHWQQVIKLRDTLVLMNRERKNLRAAIEDAIELNRPAASLDYTLDFADSIDYRRH